MTSAPSSAVFGPNFAVEGEASAGVDDGDVELNHNAGIYGVATLPVTSNFDVHGRVGYQTSEIDTPLGDFDDDGIGYGVGATYRLSNGFGIRGDYTRLDGDVEADAGQPGRMLPNTRIFAVTGRALPPLSKAQPKSWRLAAGTLSWPQASR